jgi:uncharacterized membrane protein YpjA
LNVNRSYGYFSLLTLSGRFTDISGICGSLLKPHSAFYRLSPTASLFFVFVLIAFLRGKNWPLMEALAAVTLFKYGIWAVGMNIAGGLVSGTFTFVNFMLFFSHLGMAIEGLLCTPYYKIKAWHLIAAAVWTLHNEMIDYVFGMMPRYSLLNDYILQIGYITFWLSMLSILIVYLLTLKNQNRRSISL